MSDLDQAKALLADAEARLTRLEGLWDTYTGNNLDNYRAQIASARVAVAVARDEVERLRVPKA